MKDDGWRISDEAWDQIQQILPPRKTHPLGCHNPRVSDRKAMDAILLVLRTRSKWAVLNNSDLCSRASAHRRFLEWKRAGVFEKLYEKGFHGRAELQGLDWSKLR